ncbi:spore coat protein GerQ [Ornithinibacillus halophilus]|uniref:Spore germination protein Q n=1 Tax=Ornithinibacillus halophilus TaxID=930117 RepID=A0A1M5LV80_9BACI|nr:spore coat protein GerQ [Ornithinibacillus halophilus]SHG68293.1 spore germination protein Q [Ornithinibacillus halophilus]
MSDNHENKQKQQNNHAFQQQPYYYFPQTSPAYYPAYQYRQFQFPQGQMPTQQPQQQPTTDVPGMLPMEQSYIENILRLNRGKHATVYMTFEQNSEWNAKVFRGIIEAAGRDHIILSDPQSGRRYLLLMVYLDYVTFDEEINYEYPYGAAPSNGFSTYNPR